MPKVKINGPLDTSRRLPNNLNASFEAPRRRKSAVDAGHERHLCLLRFLPAHRASGPKPRVCFIGLPHEIAHCSLRISFGIQNTWTMPARSARRCRKLYRLWRSPCCGMTGVSGRKKRGLEILCTVKSNGSFRQSPQRGEIENADGVGEVGNPAVATSENVFED